MACVSEICFRTDPENTDYVLEAGATRNFEALKKAEEQADREAQARKEELENNPMKLLEERTAASKNEMEIAESLDELRELNRRTVNIDYQGIIEGFADERRKTEEERLKAELAEDEAFVKSVFSKSASGEKIKRVRDDSSSDEETPSKFTKPENPTDFLVDKKPEFQALDPKATLPKLMCSNTSRTRLCPPQHLQMCPFPKPQLLLQQLSQQKPQVLLLLLLAQLQVIQMWNSPQCGG